MAARRKSKTLRNMTIVGGITVYVLGGLILDEVREFRRNKLPRLF